MNSEDRIDLDQVEVDETDAFASRHHHHHGNHTHHASHGNESGQKAEHNRQGNHSSRQSRRRRRRRKKKIRWIKRILLALLILLLLLAVGLVLAYFTGKSSLMKNADQKPDLSTVREASASEEEQQAGIVHYKDKTYRYRDDNINLLVIGVDSIGTEGKEITQGAGNGQSDVIVLVNVNQKDGRIAMIPINRDTMTRIAIHDQNGQFVKYDKAQLALSYGYGIDALESGELTTEAVSNLFYGLPIQGWFSMNISGISVLNDLVDGVDVVLTEDFVDEFGDGFFKGATVHLQNTMAETYVRSRYTKGDGTNASRMERQKSYLIPLIRKIAQESKKNPGFPVTLYQGMSDYMFTDIGLNEFTYLAPILLKYGFSEGNILQIPGEQKRGIVYLEYYPDEKALYELILDVFYDEI